MNHKKTILIFGGGYLQQYLINNAKDKEFFTVVIDPDENAYCKNDADVFRVVNGQDFNATLKVAEEFNVDGIITAATDKPLVMMARIGEELRLPFFSVNTALISTDKSEMKRVFLSHGIPCAKGVEIKKADDYNGAFPIIVKPRDNSGSRGVFFCKNKKELESIFQKVTSYTKKETVLVEDFIQGDEYSIETLHYGGKHTVIQFTEKTTTPFPYNVELEHKQPAKLSSGKKDEIIELINKIGNAFQFMNCASHTELKITKNGNIKIIETSPRLGGDFITSHLVPLSTGINMESLLLDIATNNSFSIPVFKNEASMAYFFNFEPGKIYETLNNKFSSLRQLNGVVDFEFSLKEGERFPMIENSLNRYGHFILQAENRDKLEDLRKKIIKLLN